MSYDFQESRVHQFKESRCHQRNHYANIEPPPEGTGSLRMVMAQHLFPGHTRIPEWQRGKWWRNVHEYESPNPDPPSDPPGYDAAKVAAATNAMIANVTTGGGYFWAPYSDRPEQDFREANASTAGGVYRIYTWRLTVSVGKGNPNPHLVEGWIQITETQHRHGMASGEHGNAREFKVEDDSGLIYLWQLQDDGSVLKDGIQNESDEYVWETAEQNVVQWIGAHISAGNVVGWDYRYQELNVTTESATLDTDATWHPDEYSFHIKAESILSHEQGAHEDGDNPAAALAWMLDQVELRVSSPEYTDPVNGYHAMDWEDCVNITWQGPIQGGYPGNPGDPIPMRLRYASVVYPVRTPVPPVNSPIPWEYRFQDQPHGDETPGAGKVFDPGKWYLLNFGWTYQEPTESLVPQSAWAESAKSIAVFLPDMYVYGDWTMKSSVVGSLPDGSDGNKVYAYNPQYREVEYGAPFRRIYFPPRTNGAQEIQRKYAAESHSDAPASNAD